jgi:hypothetical protein
MRWFARLGNKDWFEPLLMDEGAPRQKIDMGGGEGDLMC